MKKLIYTLVLLLFVVALRAQTTADSIRALIPTGTEVFRYGYNESTQAERLLYDAVLQELLGFEANNYAPYQYHRCDLTSIPNSMSIQDVMHLLARIYRDVPELYVLSSTIPRYDYTTYVYYARMSVVYTPEQYLSELQQLILDRDTILDGLQPGMTDYQKLKLMHDGFIDWGNYGDMSGAWAGSIKGAILNRRAVCEGFARAGLFLCQYLDIPCLYVGGQLCTSTTNDEWGNHAWNFVKLDGQWYLMDLTADGGFPGVCGYVGFLRGQDYFNANYRLTSADGSDANLNGVYQAMPTLAMSDYDPLATDVSLEPGDISPRKMFKDGRLIIMLNDAGYDVLGREVGDDF